MNKEQLQDIFRQPYNAGAWQELLINLFGASEIRQTPSTLTSDSNEKVEGFELGRLNTSDHYEIGLFAFEIKQGHNLQLNRVGLRSLVRSYTRYNVDAALVVYYDATHWRLSFICDIKEQKTAPKRYTYVFGNPNESYRTASAMLAKLADGKPSFENIKSAFSVEALSKDFFKGYKEQYGKFCKYIGGEQKWQRDYVKKMMGRLVFLQFLQKKGWMGVPSSNNNWEGGDLQYTQNLVKRYEANEKLLSKILEPLFFDTLNTKREGDIADPKLGNNIKIPYLNGGLFDQDKLDEKQIDFPYAYFAELMDFFSQYNFTIDENDPNDAEVGIDPEMLGHIFENLLEDNKDKGAFYTPKEIVQYMCRQSLIEYLQSKLGKHIEIENFINNHDTGNRLDSKNYIAANAKAIEELLDNVKICDPAIGSGAFPMGILSEIFHAKMALDMTLDRAAVKKNIIQNSIYGVDIEQGAVDIARLRFWLSLVVDEDEPQPLPNLDYKIMCGNSLLSRYALDMPIEDVLKDYNKGKSASDKMSLDRYKQLVTDYTNTSDHTQKAGFRNTIEEIKNAFRSELSRGEKEKSAKLKGQIADLESPMLFGERTKKEKEDLKKLKVKYAKKEQEQADIVNNKLYEDAFEWRFEFPQLLNDEGNFVGFDIVIANPPYGANIDDYIKIFEKLYPKTSHGFKDIYKYFFDCSLSLLNNEGILIFITPNTFLRQPRYGDLRRLLLENYILQLIDLGEDVFEAVVPTAISIISRRDIDIVKFTDLTQAQELKSALEAIDWTLIEQTLFMQTPNNIFIQNIRLKQENEYPLEDIMDTKDAGINYQRVKVGLNEKGNSDLSSRLLYEGQRMDISDVEYWKGVDINSYYIAPSTNRFCRRSINLKFNERVILNDVYFAKTPKLIWRQTAQYPICAIDEKGIWFGRSIQAGIINNQFRNKVSYKYLCALLNSRHLRHLYEQNVKEGGRVFPQVKLEKLKPLPIIITEYQQPFIEIVDKILEAKKADPKADTTALETKIDQMVYTLYSLTEEEIKIIEK